MLNLVYQIYIILCLFLLEALITHVGRARSYTLNQHFQNTATSQGASDFILTIYNVPNAYPNRQITPCSRHILEVCLA